MILPMVAACAPIQRVAEPNQPELTDIPVCYNFSCNVRTHVALTHDDWREVKAIFTAAGPKPSDEREQIRKAIAMMEILIGRYTPTYRDRGRNPIDAEWPGQMDCIDESRNTTTYLKLFESQGLLKWHHVRGRVFRAPYIMDQHWGAEIEDLQSHQRYVVDSWYLDNGQLPYIQRLEAWLRKKSIVR